MSPLSTKHLRLYLASVYSHTHYALSVHTFFPLEWFFCEPDPSTVGASDIGQGSIPKNKLKNKVQVELEL